ncbi:MAG: DegQ family serine endoprotease [Candidatus Krumholzibacteriia bacterium]
MLKLSSRRVPAGWVAGALLIVVGFVVGVTVTSGGGRGHAVMNGLETPASAAGPLAGQSEIHTYADVAALAMPSVVNISTDKVVKAQEGFQHPFMDDPMFRQFFQMPDNQQQDRVERSLGSGVIVSEDGYILTSNHVIAQASKIRVLMKDKQEYEAKIIGQDEGTDVALIKIDATGLPAIRIGDSSALRIGDQVMAIGNPLGVGQTVTVGIVSALGRSIGLMDYEDFIQTDAAINRGNSGGALVNMDGELVGINTAILSPSGGSIGIGFSIPSDMAKRVMDSLLKTGKVVRAWLGVQVQDVDQAMAEAHDLGKPRGVLVADVTKGAPGAKAGLKEGDVILAVDGQTVDDRGQLRNRISLAGVGETVRLSVWREGREMPVSVKLEALPADAQTAAQTGGGGDEEAAGGSGIDGVTVRELTPQQRQALSVPDAVTGLVVTDIDQTSNAWQEGLREGDVITDVARQPVTGVSEFRKLVLRDKSKPVLLRVWKRGPQGSEGGRIFMAIPR